MPFENNNMSHTWGVSLGVGGWKVSSSERDTKSCWVHSRPVAYADMVALQTIMGKCKTTRTRIVPLSLHFVERRSNSHQHVQLWGWPGVATDESREGV